MRLDHFIIKGENSGLAAIFTCNQININKSFNVETNLINLTQEFVHLHKSPDPCQFLPYELPLWKSATIMSV